MGIRFSADLSEIYNFFGIASPVTNVTSNNPPEMKTAVASRESPIIRQTDATHFKFNPLLLNVDTETATNIVPQAIELTRRFCACECFWGDFSFLFLHDIGWNFD